MKKVKVWGVVAAALVCGSAQAADLMTKAPPPAPVVAVGPWDFAIGAAITSNYLFRGISQSNNRPSVSANAEIRYNINPTFQLYGGVFGASIKLTNQDTSSPSLELDVFGGLRASLGDFSADFGAIAYTYHGRGVVPPVGAIFPTNPTFYEGYVKLGYKVTDWLNIGANAFYSPSFLDTGAAATYLAGTAKVTLPYDFTLSGELGRQIFHGANDLVHGGPLLKQKSYNYWNAGIAYTFKFATLDLRYHGTSLSKINCATITGPTNFTGSSKYCGSTFVATLSFALEGKDLK
jgi:uncharacterized protein (TIGR02001 family)